MSEGSGENTRVHACIHTFPPPPHPLPTHAHTPCLLVQTGFDFSHCVRNRMLASKGVPMPKAWSTGTTIAGVIYKVG